MSPEMSSGVTCCNQKEKSGCYKKKKAPGRGPPRGPSDSHPLLGAPQKSPGGSEQCVSSAHLWRERAAALDQGFHGLMQHCRPLTRSPGQGLPSRGSRVLMCVGGVSCGFWNVGIGHEKFHFQAISPERTLERGYLSKGLGGHTHQNIHRRRQREKKASFALV